MEPAAILRAAVSRKAEAAEALRASELELSLVKWQRRLHAMEERLKNWEANASVLSDETDDDALTSAIGVLGATAATVAGARGVSANFLSGTCGYPSPTGIQSGSAAPTSACSSRASCSMPPPMPTPTVVSAMPVTAAPPPPQQFHEPRSAGENGGSHTATAAAAAAAAACTLLATNGGSFAWELPIGETSATAYPPPPMAGFHQPSPMTRKSLSTPAVGSADLIQKSAETSSGRATATSAPRAAASHPPPALPQPAPSNGNGGAARPSRLSSCRVPQPSPLGAPSSLPELQFGDGSEPPHLSLRPPRPPRPLPPPPADATADVTAEWMERLRALEEENQQLRQAASRAASQAASWAASPTPTPRGRAPPSTAGGSRLPSQLAQPFAPPALPSAPPPQPPPQPPPPTSARSTQCVPIRVAQAFDRFDTDHSGFIERAELHAALRHYGLDLSAPGTALVLARYDDTPDGRMDLAEFAELARDLEEGLIRSAPPRTAPPPVRHSAAIEQPTPTTLPPAPPEPRAKHATAQHGAASAAPLSPPPPPLPPRHPQPPSPRRSAIRQGGQPHHSSQPPPAQPPGAVMSTLTGWDSGERCDELPLEKSELWPEGSPLTESGRYSLSLSVTSFSGYDGVAPAHGGGGGRSGPSAGGGSTSSQPGSARKPRRRQTTAMVTTAEFREVVAARAAARPLSLERVTHGRPTESEPRRVSVLLSDDELHELHRARAAILGCR